MSLQELLLVSNPDKWHRMLIIVNQNSRIVQPNLVGKFKKLSLQRLLTANILVFFIQYSGLNLGTLSLHLSPLWFATGTSCAYLFLRGYSVLPGIWLGNFFAYYLAKAGFLLSIGCATLLSAQAVLLLWFNYHYLGPTLIFYQLKMFIKFILYVALLTALVSFALFIICYSSMHHLDTPFQLWLQWWLANLNAILIFSCAFITWDTYFPDSYSMKRLNILQLLLYVLLSFFIIALCFSHDPTSMIFFALLNFLIVVVISSVFGWFHAMIAAFLSGVVLSFAAFMDAPVFSTPFASLTLLFLQLVLCVQTTIGLSIAIKCKKGY